MDGWGSASGEFCCDIILGAFLWKFVLCVSKSNGIDNDLLNFHGRIRTHARGTATPVDHGYYQIIEINDHTISGECNMRHVNQSL